MVAAFRALLPSISFFAYRIFLFARPQILLFGLLLYRFWLASTFLVCFTVELLNISSLIGFSFFFSFRKGKKENDLKRQPNRFHIQIQSIIIIKRIHKSWWWWSSSCIIITIKKELGESVWCGLFSVCCCSRQEYLFLIEQSGKRATKY